MMVSALALVFVIGCGQDDEAVLTPSFESKLVSAQTVITRPSGELRGLLGSFESNLPVEAIIHDVTMFKVDYTTMYKGQSITASGTAFVPANTDPEASFPTMSFQHGTIASNREAPSQLGIGDIQNLLYSGMAGAGFVVVVPDFIGFGTSVDIVHPYYVEEPTAQAIIDMIRAGGEIALENEITLTQDLFLSGYSQGGYATMAAHKYLEESGMEWYELKKSYPSSGGYDVLGVRDYFFSLETYDQPFFLAFVAEAYRTYYDWDANVLSILFQEPYASLIPTLFDGSNSGGQVNDQLTTEISSLVTEEFLANPDAPQFAFVTEAFQANTLLDWTPTVSIALFHGDADVTVPYQNSVDSYNSFISTGTSEDVMTFTTLPGATHGSGFFPYLEIVLNDLVAIQELD